MIWMAIVQVAQQVAARNKERNAQLGIGAGSGSQGYAGQAAEEITRQVEAGRAASSADPSTAAIANVNQQFGIGSTPGESATVASALNTSGGSFMNQVKPAVSPVKGFGLGS